MSSWRHSLICTCTAMVVLLGCKAACSQPAPSGPSPLQQRVDELARSLRDNPRFKNLTEKQRIDRVEFVVGNTLFVLLHELGHVLITELNLPVLGRQEDAAD